MVGHECVIALGPELPLSRLTVALIAGVIAALVGAAVWWYLRRRASRSIPARLRQAGDDLLAGILVPDPDVGQIHLEYAVLTRQGIVIVDVRDVAGHVFGSEPMQEWTVLGRKQRYTFANPLPALYDRIAAVKRLAGDVPVRGVVAFTARARFSKGYPPNVVMLDALLSELAGARSATDGPGPEALLEVWTRLGRTATGNNADGAAH